MASGSDVNPAIATWTGPLGFPDFEGIEDRDFETAFAVALPAHLAEIEAIADNAEDPIFENTIVALELAGKLLTRTSSIFWNVAGANTNDSLQALERKLSPELSRHRCRAPASSCSWPWIQLLVALARRGLILLH